MCHDQVPASLLFRYTSHVIDSLFTPRLSDNIFRKLYIRCSYFNFLQVQVTLPNSRRKIKRVRWFYAGDGDLAYIVHLKHLKYFVTYQMF